MILLFKVLQDTFPINRNRNDTIEVLEAVKSEAVFLRYEPVS